MCRLKAEIESAGTACKPPHACQWGGLTEGTDVEAGLLSSPSASMVVGSLALPCVHTHRQNAHGNLARERNTAGGRRQGGPRTLALPPGLALGFAFDLGVLITCRFRTSELRAKPRFAH